MIREEGRLSIQFGIFAVDYPLKENAYTTSIDRLTKLNLEINAKAANHHSSRKNAQYEQNKTIKKAQKRIDSFEGEDENVISRLTDAEESVTGSPTMPIKSYSHSEITNGSPNAKRSPSPKAKISAKWSDLFVGQNQKPSNPVPSPKSIPIPQYEQKEMIKEIDFNQDIPQFITRGMINPGNLCYINCILQPLFHCPPFFNFMCTLMQTDQRPLTQSVLDLVSQLRMANDTIPLTPEAVQSALMEKGTFAMVKGKQEDAQEFFGYLLDGLHQEWIIEHDPSLIEASDSVQFSALHESEVENDEWLEIGKRNKKTKMRNLTMKESPFSKMVTGKIRSVVKYANGKESATLEPFQTLPLFIESDAIHSLKDALIHFTEPEIIDGLFAPPKSGKQRHTQKQTFVEEFAPILVIQFKRFVYHQTSHTVQKLCKRIAYPLHFQLDARIISPALRKSIPLPQYKLFSVVNHHGKLAEGGHYTCNVLQGTGEWCRLDDENVESLTEQNVLQCKGDAYLLFYKRV